jgi:hypothetical protein
MFHSPVEIHFLRFSFVCVFVVAKIHYACQKWGILTFLSMSLSYFATDSQSVFLGIEPQAVDGQLQDNVMGHLP